MNELIKHILDNNLVVNCRTEEDAKELLKLAHESGLKWRIGTPYTELTCWKIHRERSCYELGDGGYCSDEFFNVRNMKITDFQELKKQLETKDTVLEVEFVDVFDGYKAWRIVKQDEEILKSDSVRVDILNQLEKFIPNNTSNNRHVRLDPKPFICADVEENEIREKVRLINEKYGRPKFDAEEEYKKLKEVEFVYGKASYNVGVDEKGTYHPQTWVGFFKMVGMKYISKEDAKEFCRRANGCR